MEFGFMKTKIITLYNNKGGVSKTTTLFNLAVFLSQNGKKVLIADCDPQCNATELFFASCDIDDPSLELPGTSIYRALEPRFRGEASQIDPSTVKLVESPLYENLFLFRGDLEFSRAESYLANAWNQAITENIHEKNTYVALYRLLHALGDTNLFDYILCDVGPSTGAITRMVVLACDGFFLPLIPDRFCNQAVTVLGRVMNDWIDKHAEISKTFIPFKLKSFPGRPIFLGAIIQNFKVHSASKAKRSYLKWQLEIKESMKAALFSEKSIQVRDGLNPQDPFIATIRDMGPLAPVSQMFGRAIFDIQREHTKEASTTGSVYRGTVWDEWEIRKDEYLEEIEKIAEALP